MYATIREVAEVACPVLLQGESGTGKELVARTIHDLSARAAASFVPVNCGALPEGLIESELFGHVKGSFTGATRDKRGRFELADGGTIFLDEVGELSAAAQVKLLRVLQERSFERVGGEKSVTVNVRVLSASNKDLRQEIAAGRFREDLYYRLCVVPIVVPPLRARINDIPLLAESFLAGTAAAQGRVPPPITPNAMALLMDHSWPGNVRELQNALEFALMKCKGDPIEPFHLPASLRSRAVLGQARKSRPRKLTAAAVDDALRVAQGNKVQAAKLLGASRATLYRFLEKSSERADG
jgi:DNA-binding NtrC family response regulator